MHNSFKSLASLLSNARQHKFVSYWNGNTIHLVLSTFFFIDRNTWTHWCNMFIWCKYDYSVFRLAGPFLKWKWQRVIKPTNSPCPLGWRFIWVLCSCSLSRRSKDNSQHNFHVKGYRVFRWPATGLNILHIHKGRQVESLVSFQFWQRIFFFHLFCFCYLSRYIGFLLYQSDNIKNHV